MPPYIIIYHDRKGIKWIRIRLYCHIPPLTVLLFWSPHYWLLIKRNPFSWVSHNVQSDIRILFHFCRKRFIIYEMDFKTLFCLRRKDFIRQKLLLWLYSYITFSILCQQKTKLGDKAVHFDAIVSAMQNWIFKNVKLIWKQFGGFIGNKVSWVRKFQ